MARFRAVGADVIVAPALPPPEPPPPPPAPKKPHRATAAQMAKIRAQAILQRRLNRDVEDDALHAHALALKLQGHRNKVIARMLSIPMVRLYRLFRQARIDGKLNDTDAELVHGCLPLAVEKLYDRVASGDEWAIKQALKISPYFRPAGAATPPPAGNTLEVTFIMAGAPIDIAPKSIVGRPREVIDAPVHRREIEGAAEEALCPGDPGRVVEAGGGGESPGGQGDVPAGTGTPQG